jgi:drug/metabolite transporter (DMT)-like permease
MSGLPGFPIRLAVGLVITVAIDTVVQLAWKIGVVALPELSVSLATVGAVLTHPAFYLVVGLMLVQLFNWLVVLDHADISFAQPFTALSRITVCLASAYWLGERVTAVQMIGILLVCVGAWCICRTTRMTPAAAVAAPRPDGGG